MDNTTTWSAERISKLDAARRQLRTAIRLFFEEGDSVSIHTLAAASHEILRSLVKSQGGSSALKDTDFIELDHQKDYEKLLNEEQNFFKHAGRDLNEVLDFNSRTTEFWLLDCIMMIGRLTNGRHALREFWAFTIWFELSRPEYLKPEFLEKIPQSIRQDVSSRSIHKKTFLRVIDTPSSFPMPGAD
jgi:hypothetical protein